MKSISQDLVAHTHALGFISLVKVTANEDETLIESISDTRSVVIQGKSKQPIKEFTGVFGMPNLNKLQIHLNCPEYKENAKIKIVSSERNGEVVPTGIHFENLAGDFKNDYRFMAPEVINEKLKSAKFKGANWDIVFEPSAAAIQRLKLQANAHSEENVLQVSIVDTNLIVSFGDESTHAGSYIFEPGVTGKLKNVWSWPIAELIGILNLNGDKTVNISDGGAMKISIDSGVAEYDYILPAQTK